MKAIGLSADRIHEAMLAGATLKQFWRPATLASVRHYKDNILTMPDGECFRVQRSAVDALLKQRRIKSRAQYAGNRHEYELAQETE